MRTQDGAAGHVSANMSHSPSLASESKMDTPLES